MLWWWWWSWEEKNMKEWAMGEESEKEERKKLFVIWFRKRFLHSSLCFIIMTIENCFLSPFGSINRINARLQFMCTQKKGALFTVDKANCNFIIAVIMRVNKFSLSSSLFNTEAWILFSHYFINFNYSIFLPFFSLSQQIVWFSISLAHFTRALYRLQWIALYCRSSLPLM